MAIEILGPGLFEVGEGGRLKTRVATFFPRQSVLVTLPGIHAMQRTAFLGHWNARRLAEGQLPIPPDDEPAFVAESVDLFVEPDHLLIRPDPGHMDLAFEADEQLQEIVSKRQIRFLFVFRPEVREAIRQRGEYWRISPLPTSREAMRRFVEQSKSAIGGRPIYYYSRVTGTRHLTCQEFTGLESLERADLAQHLTEIARHLRAKNRLGNPEVSCFEAASSGFGAGDFEEVDFSGLEESALRARFATLKERFAGAVPAEYREDDTRLESWRNRMFSALMGRSDETLVEEVLSGLSPEFFLQIEWLPGGRFEEGAFVVDPVFGEAERHPEDAELQAFCEPKSRGFIFNFVREHGDLAYVNVGRVAHSLSSRRRMAGRRDVFIAELKPRDQAQPIVRFLRLLKWGVREHLEEGKELLSAILESEDYIVYVLDRRLGCRQLGMNLAPRIVIRRVPERYLGGREEYRGMMLWAAYSEREYVQGIATDKVPPRRYQDEGYAMRLARLLGTAAASNLVVGRAYEGGASVVFDDGDEVVLEDGNGLPAELLVCDHSGAFDDYRRALPEFARDYARPVNDRLAYVARPREFATAYLDALRDRFNHLQGDYRRRRRAFDTLFHHCKYDPAGSFAYRWECVLERLDRTDADALIDAVRQQIATRTS